MEWAIPGDSQVMAQRRTRAWGGVFAVFVALASIVFGATQAQGRSYSQSQINDGGAWLVNRSVGSVGHMNGQVQEVSAAVRVGQPFSDYRVDQASDLVVVHQ